MSKIALLLGYIVASIWRYPAFFLSPRFWAEEGSRYFTNAFAYAGARCWCHAFFYVDPRRGYYGLWETCATILAANAVTLEKAPLVTTLLALGAQMIPVVLIVFGEHFQGFYYKALAILVMLFSMPSNEIWLTTIGSKFYLALAAFIILIDRNSAPVARSSSALRWIKRSVLAIAGLTGPVACVLAPMFLLVYLFERRNGEHARERLLQGMILGICAVLQVLGMAFFTTEPVQPAASIGRYFFIAMFTRTPLNLLLGTTTASRVWLAFNDWLLLAPVRFVLVSAVIVALGGAMLVLLARAIGWKRVLLYAGAYGTMILSAYYGALRTADMASPGVHMRYFYVPNVIFCLMLLEVYMESGLKIGWRLALGALLALILCNGVIEFRSSILYLYSADWPVWADEVAAWRSAGSPSESVLGIWPGGWDFEMGKAVCP